MGKLYLYRNDTSDVDEEQDEPSQYNPVTCTGLQPGSDVYVFGPNFQISANGSVVPTSQHQFIWIDSILQKLERPVNPLPPIPSYSLQHLYNVVSGVHTIAGDNVISGVYILGRPALTGHF